MDTLLVLRGIDSTEELPSLGLEVARKYSKAKIVIFIGSNNRPRIVKGKFDLEYLDFSRAESAELTIDGKNLDCGEKYFEGDPTPTNGLWEVSS